MLYVNCSPYECYQDRRGSKVTVACLVPLIFCFPARSSTHMRHMFGQGQHQLLCYLWDGIAASRRRGSLEACEAALHPAVSRPFAFLSAHAACALSSRGHVSRRNRVRRPVLSRSSSSAPRVILNAAMSVNALQPLLAPSPWLAVLSPTPPSRSCRSSDLPTRRRIWSRPRI